jgi:hypothetical protein
MLREIDETKSEKSEVRLGKNVFQNLQSLLPKSNFAAVVIKNGKGNPQAWIAFSLGHAGGSLYDEHRVQVYPQTR